MKKVKILDDTPTVDDDFGSHKELAEQLLNIIKSEDRTTTNSVTLYIKFLSCKPNKEEDE